MEEQSGSTPAVAADDGLDPENHPFRRSRLPLGTMLFFNGCDQFDGYLTEWDAMQSFRGEDASIGLGDTIIIATRKFIGIHTAKITFGVPVNQYGGLRASTWKWKVPVPAGVSFYELLRDHSDTPGYDVGSDPNKLLMAQYSHPNGREKALLAREVDVACWIDLGAIEYLVQVRRVKTHIGSPPVKTDGDEE